MKLTVITSKQYFQLWARVGWVKKENCHMQFEKNTWDMSLISSKVQTC